MERIHKFSRLPAAERRLLIKAALLLEAIKLGMRLLPFRTLRSLLARLPGTSTRAQHADFTPTDTVAWAVEVASRNTPGTKSCLAQALAAQALLAQYGYPTHLHIGVARGEQEQFQAHAWVEAEGKVVIGGAERERYTPLAVLDRKRF